MIIIIYIITHTSHLTHININHTYYFSYTTTDIYWVNSSFCGMDYILNDAEVFDVRVQTLEFPYTEGIEDVMLG